MASRKGAVTPGSADLLHVVLNASRKVVVNNTLDISLVDTHRERNRAAEDLHLVVAELFLNIGSLVLALAGMVSSRRDSLLV